jgi:hypothetical protein
MEDGQLFSYLYMRGFITTSMICGLGVEADHNELHEASVSIYEIYFVRTGPNRQFTHQNEENLMNCNNKFEILLPLPS